MGDRNTVWVIETHKLLVTFSAEREVEASVFNATGGGGGGGAAAAAGAGGAGVVGVLVVGGGGSGAGVGAGVVGVLVVVLELVVLVLVVLVLVGDLTSQLHASVSQGQICSDNCRCCQTVI